VGVILLGNAIGLVILVHFYQRISAQWTVVPQWLLWIILGAGYLAVFVLLLWRWIDDATWLFWRASNAEFDKYCDELGDLRTPSFDRRFLMRRIFERRLRHANRFPHENVYTRLKPSNIDGVGVFAPKTMNRLYGSTNSRSPRSRRNSSDCTKILASSPTGSTAVQKASTSSPPPGISITRRIQMSPRMRITHFMPCEI